MALTRERAQDAVPIEYILVVDEDDESRLVIPELLHAAAFPLMRPLVFKNESGGSVAAWNAAAKASTGEILIQMQDDLELPRWWDIDLRERRLLFKDQPFVIAVSDGYRNDGLLCTAICNRARYEQQGEFLHAGYKSVFSDDEFTIRALADARAGNCTVIDARDLIFRHRHHFHDPSVPFDETYRRQNSPEAYAAGEKLFRQRNAAAIAAGLKTWS
jgi:hypothetical protein